MQSIIAWAHFLSLVFLEALFVTKVALSDGGGGRGFCTLGEKDLVSEVMQQQLL